MITPHRKRELGPGRDRGEIYWNVLIFIPIMSIPNIDIPFATSIGKGAIPAGPTALVKLI